MKKVILILLALVLVGAGSAFGWAKVASSNRLARTFETHKVDFPIPFPLTDSELADLRAERSVQAAPGVDQPTKPDPANKPEATNPAATKPEATKPTEPAKPGEPAEPAKDPLEGVDLAALAAERAAERGKHLVESLYACVECHGKTFGGGTMIDAAPIGKILGVNLTSGKGGVTSKYTAADWDRIVRHGVKPDGTPAAMPSADFFAMSDRELSDIVTYIRAMPPVDNDVPRPTLGPVGLFLMASGAIQLSAEELKDHRAAHKPEAPKETDGLAFGQHMVQVCTGCHGASLAGGKIVGGDPSWPPAANLTPHAEGLKGWTYEDFVRVMREGKRKSGEPLKMPMAAMPAYAAKMKDSELQAMWAYISSVPAAATPQK
ncbi:MAG: c-type cytochrome [Deltaproteobacteria bacterium]|nr:c-type cytochrome [Deltaproteobacteria bacterium]